MAFLDPPRILVAAAAGSLAEEYCEALREAGAEPLLTNAGDDRARTEIDGLLLTGGGDVDPALYGLSSPLAAGIDSARDAFESGLLWEARQRALPTLCICRGLQIANVAFGGSLIPDLPATLGLEATVPHELVGPDGRARREPIPEHVVEIEGGSSLARIVRASNVTTGARHHQSVDRCAQELRVVGRTRDGVIEALEATFDSPFWLAVQWHPESTRDTDDGASRRIFNAFVLAARSLPRT
jgi:putative glutamine amidotransferase